MTARDDLDRALLDLAAEGRRPRCGEHADRDLWTSDDQEDRRRAAELCSVCPLLHPCAEAAEEEREKWTVRGGRDFRARGQSGTAPSRARPPFGSSGWGITTGGSVRVDPSPVAATPLPSRRT